MSPIKLLARAVIELNRSRLTYVLAGGLAASLYRKRPRMTNDVDIALFVSDLNSSTKLAEELIESLELKKHKGFIPGLVDITGESIGLIIGLENDDEREASFDVLLPSLPWVEDAVNRGKDNLVDFGFAKIPSITPEDLLIAKAFALSLEPNRFQDLDDIQSIFQADLNLDLIYLARKLKNLSLQFPLSLDKFIPETLKLLLIS